jgi:excinuclease ABC subunit A
MMEKPDVDHISGLSPAISIEQKTTSKNPRSTVGTVTEIYDYCACCSRASARPTARPPACPSRRSRCRTWSTGSWHDARGHARLSAGADHPRPQGRVPQGDSRAAQAGLPAGQGRRQFHELDEPPVLDKKFRHDIDVVVDRIVVRAGLETRLADSSAPRSTWPTASPSWRPRRRRASPSASPSRRNSPARCPASRSPRSSRGCFPSMRPSGPARLRRPGGGAVLRRTACGARCDAEGLATAPSRRGARASRRISSRRSIRLPSTTASIRSARWKDLPKSMCSEVFLHGSGEEEIRSAMTRAAASIQVSRAFEGVIPNMERRYRETDSRLDPRGFRAIPEQPPLRHLRRLPPAARGAGGEDRGPACRAGGADVDPRGLRLVLSRARPPGTRRTRSAGRS